MLEGVVVKIERKTCGRVIAWHVAGVWECQAVRTCEHRRHGQWQASEDWCKLARQRIQEPQIHELQAEAVSGGECLAI